MQSNTQILCFGEVLWDNLPSGAVAGGAPMNVALHLHQFGLQALVASSVGDDASGEKLIDFLKEAGMDVRLVQKHVSLPTSQVLVKLDENNNATYEICEPVAWDDIKLEAALEDAASKSKAIVFGSLSLRNAETKGTLLQLLDKPMTKIMDVNLRAPFIDEETIRLLLSKSNIVKLNDDELITITDWYGYEGSQQERMQQLYDALKLDVLITTRGSKGACLIAEGQYCEHQGFKVKTVDTVGSGDAFLAGFLAAMFEGKEMKQAITEACAIGAYVATQAGATPKYSKDEILKVNSVC